MERKLGVLYFLRRVFTFTFADVVKIICSLVAIFFSISTARLIYYSYSNSNRLSVFYGLSTFFVLMLLYFVLVHPRLQKWEQVVTERLYRIFVRPQKG